MVKRKDTKPIGAHKLVTPQSLFQAPKYSRSEYEMLTFYGQLCDEVDLVLLHFCLTVL